MSTFELKEITAVVGREKFYKLVKDGECQIDEFESELQSKYEGQQEKAYTIMQLVSEGERLPKTMFRHLEISGHKAFEVKTKHLRYYGMHLDATGKVLVIGGYKNAQKKDIRKLKPLIDGFVSFLKELTNDGSTQANN